MSLGLKAYHVPGADFAQRIEYNAKSGRLSVVNRAADAAGAFITDRIDVTAAQPQFALDIGSIEIGWLYFPPGAGPDATLVPYGHDMPPRPSSRHKAGFQVKVWNGREPDAREFKATAGVVIDAIEALWDDIITKPEASRGDVPVIQFVDSVAIHGKRGANYQPTFRLLAWVARDERVFGPRTVPAPGAAAPAPRVPVPAAQPPAPAAWQAPASPPPVHHQPEPARAW